MDYNETLNDILVNLFNEVMDSEERSVSESEFKNISVNDMHILAAIGIREPRNMSSIARTLSVTVGTLTIAVNNLVKKGYVKRVRSQEDRRVVLLSLSTKGQKAYFHHKAFHDNMVRAVLKDLTPEEAGALTIALQKLQTFFRSR